MDSNKSTTIGILLILLLFFVWMFLNKPTPPPDLAKRDSTSATAPNSQAPSSGQPTAPATGGPGP